MAVDPAAPNHLLVPPERLAEVLEVLRQVPGVAVRVDAGGAPAPDSSSQL